MQAAVLHHQQYGWLIPGYVVMGVGIGILMSPASTDSLNAVAPSMRSQASGVVQTLRQVGGTFGIAILGAIIASRDSGPGAHASAAAARHASTVAVSTAYWVAGGVLVFAAVGAAVILRRQAAADAGGPPQRVGERFEDLVGGPWLQALVVLDAHPGQRSDLLAPQPGHAPLAVARQASLLGRDLRPPVGQELRELARCVHGSTVPRARLPWGALSVPL